MKISYGKDIATLREAAKVEIDTRAGALRSLFFNSTPGQESEHQLKLAEAREFWSERADQSLPEDQLEAIYPLLSSDARVDGVSRGVAAGMIIHQALLWRRALAAVNELRRSAKILVDRAGAVAEIDAIVASVSAETLAKRAPDLFS